MSATNKTKFAKTMAPRKLNDTPLIRECVVYAQSIAAFQNGFKADPDGNVKYAEPLCSRHSVRAMHAVTKIAATSAATPVGLCSKARVVAMLVRDNEDGCFEANELKLLEAFGLEVMKFLEPICNGDVVLQGTAT